ncbi:hypothetical protein [Polaromonas sp.]|uniref:hypothetical protein n=1 Tax=Polaromonas sp. TaxID=1869339 RepID=UPI002FC8AC45
MEKIIDPVSVRDNGRLRPKDRLPKNFYELDIEAYWKFWGNEVATRWTFRDQTFQVDFKSRGLGVVEILPDGSGFLAMKQEHYSEAHILNGDATVRFVLKPAVNMRGFDAARLAVIEKLEIERAYRSGEVIKSWQPTALFHYKTQRQDCLEIFGDDGFGDCYYRYDTNTGELLSAETHPRRS